MNYKGMAYDFLLARCRTLILSATKASELSYAWWGIKILKEHFEEAFADLHKEGKAVFDHDHGNERFYYIYPE